MCVCVCVGERSSVNTAARAGRKSDSPKFFIYVFLARNSNRFLSSGHKFFSREVAHTHIYESNLTHSRAVPATKVFLRGAKVYVIHEFSSEREGHGFNTITHDHAFISIEALLKNSESKTSTDLKSKTAMSHMHNHEIQQPGVCRPAGQILVSPGVCGCCIVCKLQPNILEDRDDRIRNRNDYPIRHRVPSSPP